jgi:hypothetical protein
METPEPKKPRYSVKSPGRGGARANSGRKKGATTKISIESLMAEIELQSGKTYAELLTHNYVGAISRSDWNGVRDYDKAFMNKMIAEKMEVEVTNTEEVIEAKQAAFAAALAEIAHITPATNKKKK